MGPSVVVLLAVVTSAANPAPKVPPAAPDAARPLPLTAVRLLGGPLKRAQDLDAEYLQALQPDRMLAFYRKRAGLAPKAEPYGGWDGDGKNLTGHIAGHYLSAASLMWSATGDPRFKERADQVVSGLKEVQDKHGDGFLMAQAGARECFQQIVNGDIRSAPFDLNGLWVPWYVLHKTMAGLRDAYRHTGNRVALDVNAKAAAWVEGVFSRLTGDQVQKMLGTEFGGMPEVLADLYADTGDQRWLALSRRFDHRAVLDPLERQEDRLSGLHGNTNIPKLVATAARYSHAGDPDDLKAAEFFWDRVVRHHTFATGGHSKDEHFRDPDRYGEIVDGRTAESCNVYNMLKLTRRLFALRPDVHYAEFQERALFNHVLGSIDPADGATCYMVPVGRGVRREYADMEKSFTCCVGTGMENHGLHGLGIYYESGDKLWVNLYAPSRADWAAKKAQITLESDFPEGDRASLVLGLKTPQRFTLALRRPAWAGEGFAVSVNGEAVKDLPAPPAYVELDRTWKDGDVVAVAMPKVLRLEPTPDNPRRVAILWGPLVLAGNLGFEPEPGEDRRGPLPQVPPLIAAERPVSEWVKPVAGRPGEFQTEAALEGRDVPLVPFYRLHRRVYAAYFDLFTPGEWQKELAAMAAERQRLRQLERATVAHVRPGEAPAEREFNLQGEEHSVFVEPITARRGRRSRKWFSFDVPVEAAGPLALVVTYHSDQPRERRFEILVDGARLAEQSLPGGGASRFLDKEYALPTSLVEGKSKVTVRFQAVEGREIAPVFGIRVTRRVPQASSSRDPDRKEWVSISNGRNLDGWVVKVAHHELGDNYRDTFRVRDGVLQVSYDDYQEFGGRFAHAYYRRKLSHYVLALEYRFVGEMMKDAPGYVRRNSGVMVHSQAPDTILKDQNFPISVEAQFLGEAAGTTALRPTMNVCTPGTEIFMKGRKVEAHCTNSASRTYRGEEWVRVEVEVLGNERIRHLIGGQVVLEYEKPEIGGGVVTGFDPAVKRDGTPLGDGYIALQAEGQPVEFRKVELLDLSGCMDPKDENYKSYYVHRDDSKCAPP